MPTEVDLSHLAEKWPSGVFARSEAGVFTGGMIQPGTLANLDSQGLGPEGSFWFGRKKAYFVKPFIEWLQKRVTTQQPKAVGDLRETQPRDTRYQTSDPIVPQQQTPVSRPELTDSTVGQKG